MKSAQPTNAQTPQTLARDAVDRYFEALACELPFDVAPGDVNLLEAAIKIQDAINARPQPHFENENDAAMLAGYLLGVEVGRRIGGAR